MEYLLNALWSGMELVFFHFFWNAFLSAQKQIKQRVTVLALVWIVAVAYVCFAPGQLTKLALTTILIFAASLYLNIGAWYQHIIFAVIGCMINGLMDTIAIYGMSMLMRVSYAEFVWMKLFYVVTVCLSKLISILFAWILQRTRKTTSDHAIQRKWLLLALLFPAVSLVMLGVVFVGFQGESDLSISAVIFSIFLAVANVAIIYLIGVLEQNTRQLQEDALLHQQMDIQTDSIIALERSYRNQRKATHEYKNQLQTIHDLLESGKVVDAQAYVHQLQGLQTTRIFTVNSQHPIIDAVLNHKYQTAKEHQVDFQIQVNDLSRVTIRTDELVVLLSNLLDNAIEACCRLDGQRSIQCSILLEETLFLSVRNTSNPVSILGDTIPTSKMPKEEHGYGLARIQLIMRQLCAEYTFAYENGWFEFVAEIPSPC